MTPIVWHGRSRPVVAVHRLRACVVRSHTDGGCRRDDAPKALNQPQSCSLRTLLSTAGHAFFVSRVLTVRPRVGCQGQWNVSVAIGLVFNRTLGELWEGTT
ncbi:MAG: hypothetical protein QOC63_171 [Mycobacterium sp.]|nr:hypothetical protein [Mycobacterium sp.]